MFSLKFMLLFVFYLECCIGMHDTTLELVQIVARYGHKTPSDLYPNELYNKTFWSQYYNGLDVLTTLGLNQLYDFGKFIKSNYSSFLTQPYDKSRVFVKSVSYDPILTSSYTFLAGLFQPSITQAWNPQLQNWYPIPVFIIDKDIIPIPNDVYNCQRYTFLEAQSRMTVDYYKIENDNKDFIKSIANYSGVNDIDLASLSAIVYNYLIEKALNLTSPKWLTDNNDKLLKLYNYDIFFNLYTNEMAKLISGGLLNDLVDTIKAKVSGDTNLQLNAYFVYGINIGGLQKLLGLLTPVVETQFSSALIFELRKKINTTDYFVRVLYKNNPDNQPIEIKALNIAGCAQLCPLNDFIKITSDYLVNNFTEACSVTSNMYPIIPPEKTNTDLEVALIITTSVLCVIVVTLSVLLACRLCVCKQGFRKYIVQK